MKKLLTFVLGLSLVFTFAACNGKTTTTTETTISTEETFTLGDVYHGTHTVSAMRSDVVYQYHYSFSDGDYSFRSDFEMGGTLYHYLETGTYVVSGNVLSLTPSEGDAYEGTLTSDTEISVPVKASAMASRGDERTLSESDLPLAGVYDGTHTVSAMGSDVVYTYYYDFNDGSYSFKSEFEMGGTEYSYEESGTYVVTDNGIAFTPTEGEQYTGNISNLTEISVPVKASAMASRSEAKTLTLRQGE